MRKSYETGAQPEKAGLRELLSGEGREHLLPLVHVFASAGGALDQIIEVIGRAAIEAVLEVSAAEVAGLGTRSYGTALGKMAETAGVSKSSVSRYAAEAAAGLWNLQGRARSVHAHFCFGGA